MKNGMTTVVGLASIGVALVTGIGCAASHQPPGATRWSAPSSPVEREPGAVAGNGQSAAEPKPEPEGKDATPPFPTLVLPDATVDGRPPTTDGSDAGPWTGVLRTGVMAIGGETTGMTLTTDGGVYELRATGTLLSALQAADGRRITVAGERHDLTGIESRRRRRIIDVRAIVTP